MAFFESIDWGSVSAFFDNNSGKFVTTLFALIVAIISFAIAYLKFHHAKTDDGVRKQLEQLLRQKQTALDAASEELQQKISATRHMDSIYSKQLHEISRRETALNNIRSGFKGKEDDLWCLHRPRLPDQYNRLRERGRKPIVLVANLKGGVGKSTLTANLAAYFDTKGKRVLLVDCDYQGSLSNTVLTANESDEVPFGIINVLSSEANDHTFEQARRRLSNILPNTSIVSARYELASLESRILIEYLLQEDKSDGRYRLARSLLSDEIQSTYDIVFIDTPPRLTAATINAFCASTHILVATFYSGVRTLKDSLNHGIEVLGVVGMLTAQNELKAIELDSKQKLREDITRTWQTDLHFFDRHIPRRQAMARAAGESIAFCDDAPVRDLFTTLGDEISDRLGFSAIGERRLAIQAVSPAKLSEIGGSSWGTHA
jgi:cellulose biosynthesis protein BcsQ